MRPRPPAAPWPAPAPQGAMPPAAWWWLPRPPPARTSRQPGQVLLALLSPSPLLSPTPEPWPPFKP